MNKLDAFRLCLPVCVRRSRTIGERRLFDLAAIKDNVTADISTKKNRYLMRRLVLDTEPYNGLGIKMR